MIRKKQMFIAFLTLLFFALVPRASGQSNLSKGVNDLFWLVTILSAVVLLIVVSLWIYFIVKYNENNTAERTPMSHTKANQLEMIWTLVAISIVILLMVFSYPVLMGQVDDAERLQNGIPIVVEGSGNWEWRFHLQNGTVIGPGDIVDNKPDEGYTFTWTEIHLKLNTAYTFIFWNSGSFIHSFFVKDLNIKMDVIPGTNNTMTFSIVNPGVYEIRCAEFCGAQHSFMRGAIVVEA